MFENVYSVPFGCVARMLTVSGGDVELIGPGPSKLNPEPELDGPSSFQNTLAFTIQNDDQNVN
jgi:hypothetical protein